VRRALPVAAAAAVAVFVGSWLGIHNGWFAHSQLIDTPTYQKYGDAMARGEVPYRDFLLEYPPGALPVFVLPTGFAASQSPDDYRSAFEDEMLALGIALVLIVAVALVRLEPRIVRALPGFAVVSLAPLLAGSVILTRFDLWPAALVAGALAALLWGRESSAAILLAVATAAKLWPAVLVPLVLAWEWRRRGRRYALDWATLLVLVLACCFVPFAILSAGGLAHSLGVQLRRPLQVESLGSSVLMALHHLFGLGLHFHSSYGSQNLTGVYANFAAVATLVVEVSTLLAIWILFARGPAEPERIVAASAGAVAAFIAFGKVFSPQFLIWLVPVVALVRGLAAPALLVAALALTQTWFPHDYWPLALGAAEPQSWLLLARNLCVVALAAVLLRRLQHHVLREDRPVVESLEPVRRQVQLRPP
jgi:hypothetical protein